MQQLLHTHTTMVRVSSSPAIINLSGFITLSTWKAISIKTTFTGAKCFVNNAALFIHSMEHKRERQPTPRPALICKRLPTCAT